MKPGLCVTPMRSQKLISAFGKHRLCRNIQKRSKKHWNEVYFCVQCRLQLKNIGYVFSNWVFCFIKKMHCSDFLVKIARHSQVSESFWFSEFDKVAGSTQSKVGVVWHDDRLALSSESTSSGRSVSVVGLRGEAPASHAAQGGHAGVIPPWREERPRNGGSTVDGLRTSQPWNWKTSENEHKK